MKIKQYYSYILILSLIVVLQGCASQPEPSIYGSWFFIGLWHGFTAVFSFIGSIFSDIRIYEFPNSWFWYDFDFLLGIAVFIGSGAASN